jgi:biopolymer transport protein ExbB/TolQ
MMIRRLSMLAITGTLLWTIGCDKPGVAEQQRETNAAQENAERQNGATREAASAQAEKEQKVAAAQAEFDKTREDYRHERQKDLDDLDVKIADVGAKAKTATGAAKSRLDQSLPALRSQRAAFSADLRSSEAAPPATWDADKARLDKEYDSLKAAIDKAR